MADNATGELIADSEKNPLSATQEQVDQKQMNEVERSSDSKTMAKVSTVYLVSSSFIFLRHPFVQGLVDVAFLSATANQLRHAIEMETRYMPLLITLFSLSLVLQIVSTGLLVIGLIVNAKS